jgi:Mrp family chromosome partitioning ATPase
VYEAEGVVLLTDPRTGGATATELSLLWNPNRYLRNQEAVMQSPAVMDRAAEILGDPYTADDVAESISVRAESDVDALTVSATSEDSIEPVDMVNATVQAYSEIISEQVLANAENTTAGLETSKTLLTIQLEELDQQVAENPDDSALLGEQKSAKDALIDVDSRIRSITTNALLYGTGIQLYIDPQPPAIQIAPTPARNAAIAFVLAALASGVYAWWRAERDQRADNKDIPAAILGAPLLAVVPEFESVQAWAPAPTVTHPDTAAAEAYNFALSSLSFVLDQTGGRSVLITSPSAADGKTSAALNLAVAAMKDGRSPLLIDGDERAGGLTRLAGIETNGHQSGPVGHGVSWAITPSDHLDFIAAGRNLEGDTAGYFRSVEFRKGLHSVMEGRDLVLIDSPPVMSASETADLAAEVDAVVLVVRENESLHEIADARDRLLLSGTPIVGYIFNRATHKTDNYSYSSRRNYGSTDPT